MGLGGVLGRRGSLSQLNYWTWKRSTFFYWVNWALKLHTATLGSISSSIVVILSHWCRPVLHLQFTLMSAKTNSLKIVFIFWISDHFDHQKGAHISFSLILLPLQKPVKESSHHTVMAALPEPPTLRAVSLMLHHSPPPTPPRHPFLTLSVSVIGFFFVFPYVNLSPLPKCYISLYTNCLCCIPF